MVSLVRLSSSNLDEFKKLYEENFKERPMIKIFLSIILINPLFPKCFQRSLLNFLCIMVSL